MALAVPLIPRSAGRPPGAVLPRLFDARVAVLLPFARVYVGDPDLARDVLRQTFGAAQRALAAGIDVVHGRAWLFHVARAYALTAREARGEAEADVSARRRADGSSGRRGRPRPAGRRKSWRPSCASHPISARRWCSSSSGSSRERRSRWRSASSRSRSPRSWWRRAGRWRPLGGAGCALSRGARGARRDATPPVRAAGRPGSTCGAARRAPGTPPSSATGAASPPCCSRRHRSPVCAKPCWGHGHRSGGPAGGSRRSRRPGAVDAGRCGDHGRRRRARAHGRHRRGRPHGDREHDARRCGGRRDRRVRSRRQGGGAAGDPSRARRARAPAGGRPRRDAGRHARFRRAARSGDRPPPPAGLPAPKRHGTGPGRPDGTAVPPGAIPPAVSAPAGGTPSPTADAAPPPAAAAPAPTPAATSADPRPSSTPKPEPTARPKPETDHRTRRRSRRAKPEPTPKPKPEPQPTASPVPAETHGAVAVAEAQAAPEAASHPATAPLDGARGPEQAA